MLRCLGWALLPILLRFDGSSAAWAGPCCPFCCALTGLALPGLGTTVVETGLGRSFVAVIQEVNIVIGGASG